MNSTTSTLGRFTFALVLGLMASTILPGMAPETQADSFNAKPGAWEMTFTGVPTGMMIPPDALAKMPPEQRARLEQSMQARSGKANTHVHKSCITKEDLDQNRIIKEEDEDEPGCTTTVVSKSSSKLVLERSCPAPHATTSRMAMETKTPESIVASMDTERAGAGKVHIDIKGRWLGASCAGIAD